MNRTTGEQAVGRAVVTDQFVALFKEQPELNPLQISVPAKEAVARDTRTRAFRLVGPRRLD